MENDDKYLPELLAEKDSLDSSFTHAMKLLNAGDASHHLDGVTIFPHQQPIQISQDSEAPLLRQMM